MIKDNNVRCYDIVLCWCMNLMKHLSHAVIVDNLFIVDCCTSPVKLYLFDVRSLHNIILSVNVFIIYSCFINCSYSNLNFRLDERYKIDHFNMECDGGTPSSSDAIEDKTEYEAFKSPVCLIVLGMAGSGKTTFVSKLNSYLRQFKRAPYLINLDPACKNMPYTPNIDIRDSVKYKQVMKNYGLGPNGAIVTALNLYTTKFHQLMDLLGKINVENSHDIAVIDTPGQIEVFTWSASGQILTESLASTFPTVVVYVMDLERSTSPITFMSNMLYACSVLYKTKLPFIVVLNKSDIVDPTYAIEWMHDFEAFCDAVENESSYMSNLTRTMALTLDEFYNELKCIPVSSLTGHNFDEFFKMVDEAADEFQREYRVEWNKLRKEKLQTEISQLNKKLDDLAVSSGEGELVPLFTSLSAGREISDIYLAPNADEMSGDSEGEEVPSFNVND